MNAIRRLLGRPVWWSELVEVDPRFERYSRQTPCVSISAVDVKDWGEITTLIVESYRLNARPNS